MKSNVALIKKRIEYKEYYFLIVPDIAAGRRYRYTVYRVPSSPSRRIKILGREIDLKSAKRIVKEKDI